LSSRSAGAAQRGSRVPPRLLPRHISFGLVYGRPVFADPADDSYFMLGPEEERRFLERLRSGDPPRPAAPPAPAETALQHVRSARPTLLDVAVAGRLLAGARSAVRRQPISSILEGLECLNRNGDVGTEGGSDCAASAARFASARRFVPVAGNCLTDSLALSRWLAREGHSAALILGVKLDPFAAHCWVQSGGMVLNDHLESVGRFTPVRIVECTPVTR